MHCTPTCGNRGETENQELQVASGDLSFRAIAARRRVNAGVGRSTPNKPRKSVPKLNV
jgi:hypothetical protein